MNELEWKIAGTFKQFQPKRFREANGRYTDKILETILLLVKRYPNFDWHNYGLMSERGWEGGAFCSTTNNLIFGLECYEDALTDKDVAFVTAHEVGHMFDWQSGRISYDYYNDPDFLVLKTGERIPVQLVEDLLQAYNTTEDWEQRAIFARAYGSTNAEYIANVFAAGEVERPDDEGFQIFHDVGSGKLAKLEIDA